MTAPSPPREDQWEATVRRHEAARLESLRADASRTVGENLEEGARLSLAATTLADAFADRR